MLEWTCQQATSDLELSSSSLLIQYRIWSASEGGSNHSFRGLTVKRERSFGRASEGLSQVTCWCRAVPYTMEAMKVSTKTHEEFSSSSHSSSSSSVKKENGTTHGIYVNMAKEKLNVSHLTERINSTERLKKESTEHLSHLEDGPRRSPKDDVELFDTAILRDLEFPKTLNERGEISINPATSEDSLILRALRRSDYDLEYIELLSQLTVVGTVTPDMFDKRFDSMRSAEGNYYTIVIEEKLPKRRIVGTVTLVIEQKFIRATALRGRIEDVVVHRDRRGQDLGKLLLKVATMLSKSLGCYKVSLECKDRLVDFYSQFGYEVDPGNNYMTQRFRE